MPKSLRDMQEEVLQLNRAKGWYDFNRPFEAEVAHLHAEVTEMFEAYRQWGVEDQTNESAGIRGGYDPESGTIFNKPEGIQSEMADVLIRLLDTCERYGVDLEAEYDRKMAYNRTRPYRHGGKKV